ncbi:MULTISPECIES: hypothetical protein [unclassified Roseobacter]|nr:MULTISPECIES: hypothetical protein [unclassified Roseobacter]NNV87483.1 hypothetical protein [Roseobacter sp. HKCCD8414]NNW64441.1 hypothetical protein [Roseobacter sp. HKCCD8268]NNW81454.1 hypothetical protein [Roseobacter sp. HKCCD8134]NNW89577.1 hypothetical protein [Roseobacter sp. HKCCD8272]NNY13182.1 hypothetical protein [Roseobacter sp. HKCCD8413]NNY51534.1 hypothetical protein [Roseobacter sp. HKCCD8190]NNZ45500.1 hypothetical protein [Roseobacter sp. HKCCD9051]NNZ71055.1 hypothe
MQGAQIECRVTRFKAGLELCRCGCNITNIQVHQLRFSIRLGHRPNNSGNDKAISASEGGQINDFDHRGPFPALAWQSETTKGAMLLE